ncbi:MULTISPECIES: aromatic ring-hydroxylating oxygenase subunit alpha [Streptomyces]|uniref:aromatic ring-hydroxylating oxygenase subunit alpha n=1 Tax=Streptomyces TaxID=1883 RepID=UPI00177F2B93|nr:aromatic ring-hydroxylating dioxygenase subunit alpha [Streptomyces sp. ME02-6978.2a]MDX3362706.1 aromatic ring-hydroxylating dioxygenase subunit alpha [Streptomyces sp. ME02-6978.2a]WTI28904.1 aromatic ring-hydroxylating dioxygenase subunit alpha [Streptomyces jietaisiensis]GHE65472.1 oxidase [Streptomyces griseoaurantiacus]
MIPNQWYPILQTSEIQREKPTGVRRMGEELVLWRDLDGTLVCQTARCPHKGANIGDGRLKGNTVECPYHGFRFDAEGTCKVVPALGAGARIPASLKLRTYPVREQHGLVWLWWGEEREHLPAIELPAELVGNSRPYETISWTRPLHYTRYIESLLEFYHVTFVHRDHWTNNIDYTFMYGTARRFWTDGRDRYLAANKIVNHEVEVDGTTIRSTFDQCEEADPENTSHFHLIYQAPGLTHVKTGLLEITTWLTPIDEENTLAIMRLYEYPMLRAMVPFKPLRPWVLRASLLMERLVQDPQDVGIMLRQEPKVSERGVNKFIAVDEMNAKFLQMRDRLKAEAAAHADAPEETPAPAAPNGKAAGAGGKSTGAGGKGATTARGRRTAKTEPRTDDLAEARP